MFERFTSRARQVIVYAQDEAHTHERIGTEHLLLGLLREQDGAGAKILTGHGVDREKARDQIVLMTSARRTCRIARRVSWRGGGRGIDI